MYWPAQDDSIVDASGNKLEQVTANSSNLDRSKERHLTSTPLDLSGSFADSQNPREVESPLDLSLKTRKRQADSAEIREMYLAHQQMYSFGKRPCVNATQTQMPYLQKPIAQTVLQGPSTSDYGDQRQTMDRHISLQRQYLEHTKLIERNHPALEQRHALEQRQAFEQRQQVLEHRQMLEQRKSMEDRQRQVMEERQRQAMEERQRQIREERHLQQGYSDSYYTKHPPNTGYPEMQQDILLPHRNSSQQDISLVKQGMTPPWQTQQIVQNKSLTQEHYRRTSQIRYPNRMKNPSSDEQYYAMLQTIQKQNAAKKQQMEKERIFAERTARIQESLTATQPKLSPKVSTMSHPTPFLERPAQAYLQKPSLNNDVNYNQQLWKSGFSESAQQRMIAETAQQQHGVDGPHVINIGKHRNPMASYNATIKQEHPDLLPASGYKKPLGNEMPIQMDQRHPYLSQASQIQHSSNALKDVMMTGNPHQMKGLRNSCSRASSEIQMPHQSERSIMKGTSGVYGLNGLQKSALYKVSSKQFETHEGITKHSSECQKSCDGHEVPVSSHKSSRVDQYSKQRQINKVQREEPVKKKESDDSLNDNRLVTQLFRGIITHGGGNLLNETLKQREETKVPREDTKAQESSGSKTDVVERLSSPLSISIPNTSNSCKTEEKLESKPRPFSKKQLIMNAVNRDEDLRKIVSNSEKPKTVIFSNPDIKRSQTTSPIGPESPKMPTLSPQQKLQPSCLSHQVTEPPTLDIDGSEKHDSYGRSGTASYCQDKKRIRLLSSLPKKTQPVIEDEEEEEESGETQNEVSIHANSVFANRPFLHYKKIPIANVAPMVHENSTEEQKDTPPITSNGNTGQKRKLDETFDKHITSSIKTYLNENSETAVNFSRENETDFSVIDVIKEREQIVKGRRLSDSECVLKSSDGCDQDYKPLKIERRHKSLIQESSSSGRIPEHKNFMITDEKIDSRPTFRSKICSTSKTQKKADDIRRRARERHQQRQRNKQFQENQSLYIKSRRHSQDKARGFIDFKPEVLVNRTRTKTCKTEIPSDSDDKTEDEGDIRRFKKRVYKKSGQRNVRKDTLQKKKEGGKEVKNNTECSTSISLKIASIALTDCVNKNIAEVNSGEGHSNDGPIQSKQETQEAEEKGSASAQPEVDSHGVPMKLLIRPKQKRRFRRRSSTKRIGKCRRRRTKFRKKEIMKKNIVPLTFQDDIDDDVFANDDVFGLSANVDTSDDLPHTSAPVPGVGQEIKKLVVCKDTGETMLHRAARLGHLDVVIYCLQSGDVDVNTKDNAGYTPLHECCVSGNLEIARLLLSRGANVNCASQDGIRPIHDAVENDNVEMVRLLIVYGADPTLATYTGASPLKIAHSEGMRSLITGYLGDINGFSGDQIRTAWEFDLYGPGCLPETEVFSNIPEDPPLESKDQYVEEATLPLFPVIKVQNGEVNRSESFVLVRDVCEFYRVKPSDALKHLEHLNISELSKEDILQNKENCLLFQKLSMLSTTQLPAVSQGCVGELIQTCIRLSNGAETTVTNSSPSKTLQKESSLFQARTSTTKSPQKQNNSPTKSYKHSPKNISKEKSSEQKTAFAKRNSQKDSSKSLSYKKKLFSEDWASGKPSTSGLVKDKSQPGIVKSKSSLKVFDLTSTDESTDDEFNSWEPSTDLKVVKYRHDNIELVSKSSASKIKHKK
ncbi:uncharacterized protein LOC134250466 [Saccostrea cucullata]|uniref:uncharacterized protein LOC134250466 n=1 Tax=Saccostrea cuccullata TaxID=36930 RepID=UPI002ED087E4